MFKQILKVASTMMLGASLVIGFPSCENPEVMNTLKEMQEKDSLSSADIAKLQSLLKQAQGELDDLKNQTPSEETSGGSSTPSGVSKSEFGALEGKFDKLDSLFNVFSKTLSAYQTSNNGSIKTLNENINAINATVNGLNANVKTLSSNDEKINDYFTKLQETLDKMNQAITEAGGTEIDVPTGPEVEETDTVEVPEIEPVDTTVVVPPTPGEETTEHEYVDLGLSVMWATCNIGAENPWDYGQYFAWGDTIGYAKDEAHEFNWENCFDTTDGNTFTIYNNEGGLTELTADHDAATKNWGGKWRMPSKADFDELSKDKIYSVWVTNYKSSNVSGRVFYKKKEGEATYDVDSDVHIFLPAAGYRDDGDLDGEGSDGYYWSRSLNENYSFRAWYLYFDSSGVDTRNHFRLYGRTVRPVCPRAD